MKKKSYRQDLSFADIISDGLWQRIRLDEIEQAAKYQASDAVANRAKKELHDREVEDINLKARALRRKKRMAIYAAVVQICRERNRLDLLTEVLALFRKQGGRFGSMIIQQGLFNKVPN